MAKLIVTRPRHFADSMIQCRVRFDGVRIASIGCGQTVEIDIPHGTHDVSARVGCIESWRVRVDGTLEVDYVLVLGFDREGHLRASALYLLSAVPFLLLMLIFMYATAGREPASAVLARPWI